MENESGARLSRPELFRLLADARPGDILLVEQVDRLSRLTQPDWERLKAELSGRRVRVVALDLPTSWTMAAPAAPADEFTARMLDALNGMMLDVLAAVARKDYDDRRRRQAQGQARAKAEGRYKGRPEDARRNAGIASMLRAGLSWSAIRSATGASRTTIAKVAKRLAAVAAQEMGGKDAGAIVAAGAYDRARAGHTGRHLAEALATAPLSDIAFDRPFVTGPVRDIEV